MINDIISKGIVIAALSFMLFSCTPKEPSVFTEAVLAIDETAFQKTIDDKEVNLYTLVGDNGMGMKVTNYGARIVALCVPDKNGDPVDVVLGYNSLDAYKPLGGSYMGAAIGRFANRIAKGKFFLGDKEFQLPQNNGENALHGGPSGFQNKVWDATLVNESKILFTMVSPDGDQGYPGTLTISMTYEITVANELVIDYSATTDKVTICNLTHHSYFNLSGEGAETINDHVLTIKSDLLTPVDESLIPTGELMPVEGTAFDFNEPSVIGDKIEEDHIQLKYGNGYDQNWIVNKTQEGIELVSSVYSPITNVQMDVLSDQPGIQFYSANFLSGKEIGKEGKAYPARSALCLETQHYPDSPNQAHFPTTTLLPGDIYKHICIYKFSVKL